VEAAAGVDVRFAGTYDPAWCVAIDSSVPPDVIVRFFFRNTRRSSLIGVGR
jgi:hypothetical protein